MAFTESQQAAIDFRGENLLLSAAAGSGKTTVLVERVLSLLEEGADIGGMLIVTFTRASASDMRQSLIRRLNERALTDARFHDQAERAERASISTIHSFLIEMLRAHFQAADLDPSFRVADTAQSAVLLSRAFEEAMNRAYEEQSAAHQTLIALRAADEVESLARALYAFSLERRDPFGWLEEACAQLERGTNMWAEELTKSAARHVEQGRAYLREALLLCVQPEGPASYEATLSADLAALDGLSSLSYEGLRQALTSFSFGKLKAARGGDAELREQAKALREAAKKAVEAAQKQVRLPLAESLLDVRATAEPMRALVDIVRNAHEEYQRTKADKSLVTFNDLEHFALRALNDPRVCEEVRSRFTHVFVDEYQDVSDVQEAILSAVSRGDNLFMVGDVKQSIYRFRQAEPTLFLDKYNRYGQGEGGRLIALNRNFRARSAILDVVNAVFERLMVGGASEIVYDEGARLYPGAVCPPPDPPVECDILIKTPISDESDEADALIEDMRDAELEAECVARRINALLGTPFYDARQGRERPLEPKDFCVLLRQAKDVSGILLSALSAAGIPAYADVSGGYMQAWEVRLMLALLKLTDNRRQDLEWIALLRSPIGRFTSHDLAQIRIRHPRGAYHEAIFALAEEEDALAGRVREMLGLLDGWRSLRGALPLRRLIDRVAHEAGLYEFLGALPGGARRQANIVALCDKAAAYEQNARGGLAGFLLQLEKQSAAKEDMGEAHVLEGENVVRVMTVHKSKGLEFPVVIGAQLGRKFRLGSRSGEMCLHRELGAGLMHTDVSLGTRRDTVARLAVIERQRQEALAEEMRILYVLLTRPKDRLILIGCAPSEEAMRVRALGLGEPECFLHMLAPAILGRTDLPLQVRFLSRAGVVAGRQKESMAAAQYLEEALKQPADEKLQRRIAWQYPYEQAVLMPLKINVSQAAREVIGPCQPPALVERPEFLRESGMTAAEKGTAAHTALRHMELSRLRGLRGDALCGEICAQVDAMAASGRLTQAQKESIRPWTLTRFFEQGAGARMISAEQVRREWMFVLRMPASELTGMEAEETMLLQGAIDACFMEEGQWVLLDYKTDREQDEEKLLATYGPQVELYRRALKQLTGIPVKEAILCLIRDNREIPVDAEAVARARRRKEENDGN